MKKEKLTKEEEDFFASIDEIPEEEGWWNQDTGETFKESGLKMLRAGMKAQDALDILNELYGATADEFGG